MEVLDNQIVIENTKPEFEGDFTYVVFSILKQSKKGPEQTAQEIGEYLKTNFSQLANFNVIKGFLNMSISNQFWFEFLNNNFNNKDFGFTFAHSGQKILVEYSSPNTNKPLHLGHIRNNLLGYSVAQILKANGHEVHTCNLVNDRGIHICKSMYAWMQFGNGETPESAGLKGDHLVGKYYVIFDKQYKQEIEILIAEGLTKEEAEKKAPAIIAAQQLLQKWEANDEETVAIWKKMNGWVYQGFEVTYKKLGVQFDKFYYESNTYILGKDIVQQGLNSGAFFKKDDGSVWIDLTADGLDQKLLLRGDGTSVYITQDIGTAELKYKDFDCERSVYVVGNEQDYHFKVLQLICKRLHKPFADGIFHLSYGMVELPHGKMKSREGTVVDADELIDEMIATATETTKALGKTEGIPENELQHLFETIGMGALKYYLLKVDPKKKMMFNPEESIDFQGNTGPFIQYTHARIKSILRNAGSIDYSNFDFSKTNITEPERKLAFTIYQYPQAIADAGKDMSPGIICNYAYDLAKAFNHFYHECSVLKEENESQRNFRIQLVNLTAHIIKSSFGLLGINVPEKM
ncbi:MAG: arginine--tRNA ligase [Bacteroidia bacterium]|nr:arginine--tRNA ligase [Bacteroidia bacterium]